MIVSKECAARGCACHDPRTDGPGVRVMVDETWPFPQYDEEGKRVLPPPPPKQPGNNYPDDMEDALL